MSDEKIMILKMLEDGKIGAEEAAKLLAAVKEAEVEARELPPTTPPSVPTSSTEESYGYTSNNGNGGSSGGSGGLNFDELGRSLGSISKDVAKKAGIFAKEMAPKLQTLTETLVEKTVSVTDRLSKSLNTPPPAPSRPATPPPRPATPPRSTPRPTAPPRASVPKGRPREKSCEIEVGTNGNSELYITSLNGIVFIKGYNGDKITAKLNYTASNDNINLTQSGDRYYLDYDENEFSSVSIEAFVPERLFKRIQIVGKVSQINIDSFSVDEIVVDTNQASINLKNIGSNYIKAITDKGEVILDNIISKTLEVITANAKIQATSLDIQRLKAETDNAPISYKIYSLKNYTNYNWRISTSNAGMKVNLPISEDIGYDIKANTSLNNVSVGIAGLQYIENSSSYVEAKTANFEKASKQIKIDMDTSNAPINVN